MRDKRRLRGGFTVFNYKLPTRNPETGVLEKHAPLANFLGPGTRVQWRLKNNIQPTTKSDNAARTHDIEYANIGSRFKRKLINEQQAKQAIRNSDKKIVAACTRNLGSLNPVERMHATLGASGIVGKMAAENLGVMNEMKFIDPNNALDEDLPMPAGAGKKKKPKKPKVDRIKKLRKIFKKL